MMKFKHGYWILILVTSKYGKAAMCACIPAFVVPRHGPRVNRGFSLIQQQPSHHRRQQCATTHPYVPFFWTEKHLNLLSGRLGVIISIHSFAVLSLKAIHRFLPGVPFPR